MSEQILPIEFARSGNYTPMRLARWFRVEITVAIGTALVLALIWTTFRVMSHRAEHKAVENGFAVARAEVNLLALKLEYRLAEVDKLHYLARTYARARQVNSPEQDRRRIELERAVVESEPDVYLVFGVTPDGEVDWTTWPGSAPSHSIADRSYYKAIVAGADRFVGEPTVGEATGRPNFQFARATRADDGKLLGMTVVGLDAGIIKRMTSEVTQGQNDSVTLVRGDGVVLARNMDWPIGASVGPLLLSSLRRDTAEFERTSPYDGITRLNATRRISGSDMMIVVGLEKERLVQSVLSADESTRRWLYVLTVALAGNALAITCGYRFRRKLLDERRRAGEAEKREMLLRQIAENATDMIGLLDENLELVYVNPAYLAGLCPVADQALPRRFGANIEPEDMEHVEVELAAVVKHGGSRRMTYRARDADDQVRWLETEMVAINAPSMPSTGSCRFMALTRDITSRRQDENALREAQAHVQAMLCHGGGLLYRLTEANDVVTRTIIMPPSGCDFALGWSSYDLVQPEFFTRQINPDDAPSILAAIARCRETGEAVVEYRFKNAAGEQRWLRDQMMLGPPEDSGCEIIVYVTDITDEYLRRQQLQQSERLATLGLLTTNIAHEINQPLAAIGMAAENGLRLLQRGMSQRGFDEAACAADSFQVERTIETKLQRIIAQTHRIAGVISHVRAYGRSDGSQPEDVDVEDIINEALMLAEGRLSESGVAPRVNLHPNLPLLHTFRVPLEQVVMNIIVNACDAYDGKGSVRQASLSRPLLITSRAECDTILLSIADRAGGIPPEVLNRIFDPFFTTKPVGLGTGVGLFVSMISINELGGTLTARNEAGGAVFDIRLPLTAATRPRQTLAARLA